MIEFIIHIIFIYTDLYFYYFLIFSDIFLKLNKNPQITLYEYTNLISLEINL